MKERPVLFSAPMVRAILEGRKTQTRRVARLNIAGRLGRLGSQWHPEHPGAIAACPYGKPGDRLWVRETWGVVSYAFDESGDRVKWTPDRPATTVREMRFGNRGYYTGHVIYAADGQFEWTDEDDSEIRSAWKPSIHMPRRASRITLEITDVRVERVQAITDEDALAEGIHRVEIGSGYPDRYSPLSASWQEIVESAAPSYDRPRDAFRDLWEAINALRGFGWNANPWVWALTFKRVEQPA